MLSTGGLWREHGGNRIQNGGEMKKHGKLLRAFMLALGLGVFLVAVSSCVGIQSDPESDLPNNTPAKWEGQSLAIPM